MKVRGGVEGSASDAETQLDAPEYEFELSSFDKDQ